MKRIYCDGIFDLFHMGHLHHLRQIHNHFDEPIHLIVGVISDRVATGYKRKPFMCEYDRARIIEACMCLDANITNVMRFIYLTPYLALHIAPYVPMFSPKSFHAVIYI